MPLSTGSSGYNSVDLFEEQIHTMKENVLQSIGSVFQKHNHHRNFGLGLLHRHHELAPGNVMAFETLNPVTVVCRMEPIGRRQLFPASYYLNNEGTFVPFEYTDMPAPGPKEAFLSEMTSVLRESQLERVLAITSLSPMSVPSVEMLLDDNTGTISTKVDGDINCIDGVVTEWEFVENGEVLNVRVLKKCTQNRAGGHEVTPDTDS